MNTYELTEDKKAIIVTYPDGMKSLFNVDDIANLKQGVINSKALVTQDFDKQIAEYDRQLAFIAESNV